MDKPKNETPKDTQIEVAKKELQELLEKHGMELIGKLSFPRYNQLPDDAQLALAVIMKHEPRFNVVLSPKKQDK